MNVNAQDEVNKINYQSEVLEILNQYSEKFDDCFLPLPTNFPDVSTEYLELNDRIGELEEKKWYHRIIETSYYGQVMHEVFFYMKWGNTRYAISIQYFFINNTQKFTIPALYLLSDDYGGETGDFGHIIEGGIPSEIADASKNEIKTCMETPGFLFMSFIMAIAIILIYYSRYKK